MHKKQLTDDQVREIQALLRGGKLSGNQIAKKFGVSKNIVSKIKLGERIPYSPELIKRGTPNKPGKPENKARFGKKLSDDDARVIKQRIANKELLKDIAKDYGVHVQAISSIKRGITFKHVK